MHSIINYLQQHQKTIDFDKSLNDMEHKIMSTVSRKRQSTENSEEIQIGDTVAVLVPQWNKWVRGNLKEMPSNGSLYVWAIDYGVPIVSKASNVIKLPTAYIRMNMKYPRIHLGGLIDCVPAESEYDYQKDGIIVSEKPIWSEKAIEIGRTAIDSAIQVKFENVKEFKLMDRSHHFGHLKCQKADGTWTHLNKCLSNALAAKITTDDWIRTVCGLESIRIPEWKSFNGNPLNVINLVVETTSDADRNEASNQSIEDSTVAENTNVNSNVNENNVAENQVTENQIDKKKQLVESTSGKKRATANSGSSPNARPSGTRKSYGPFRGGQFIRSNQYPMKGINTNMYMNRSFSQMRISNGGIRWPNPRDRSYHNGRIPSKWEQEYFESCIGKSDNPTEKHSSASSSAAEDSNDESNDNQNKTEMKQENPNKSNETTNDQEMKNATTVASEVIDSAIDAGAAAANANSTQSNGDKNTA